MEGDKNRGLTLTPKGNYNSEEGKKEELSEETHKGLLKSEIVKISYIVGLSLLQKVEM